MSKPKLYIVEAAMLPEVFLKVCDAKEYLQTGAASTVAEAAAMAGISRSAFYKYKDAIRPFRDIRRDQPITMSILMRDRPGALSSVLSIFAALRANILTINQSIPANGVGVVTIAFITEDMETSPETLSAQIDALPDVIRTEVLAG
jgi:chorismate mutase